MATPDAITVSQLSRLIGTPDAPCVIDVPNNAKDHDQAGMNRQRLSTLIITGERCHRQSAK